MGAKKRKDIDYLDDDEEDIGYLDDDEEDTGYLDDDEDNAGYLDDDEEDIDYFDDDEDNIDYLDDEEAEDEEMPEDDEEDADAEDDDLENYEGIERRRRRKHKRIRLTVLTFLIIIIAATAGGAYYINSLAYKVCRVEAGVPVSPSDFLKEPDENAFFTKDSQAFDVTEPGEYKIRVKSGIFVHWCTLIIEDTISPEAAPVQVALEIGESCDAESFVKDIADATHVNIDYVNVPDFSRAGRQLVKILLTDQGNNQTVIDSEMFISRAHTNITVEAGSNAPAIDNFIIEAADASFVTNMETLDYSKVGDYEVSLKVDGLIYKSVLHIVDTIPPEAEVHDVEGFAFVPVSADDFTVSTNDVTEVTAAFAKEPDLSYIGTQDLEIVYTDDGGNEVIKPVKLTLIEDTEAPVIEGAADLRIFIGDSVSYRKNITVSDNCPDGLVMTVDTSSVNINEEGIYPVTYTAKDLAGNTASVTVNLAVTPRMYDINEVYAVADSILADIITPEMSQLEQAKAIYDYIVRHVSYISDSAKDDWVRAAYEGLVYGKGDCFVYACTAKVLLTRAGIANMDIEKIPSKSHHYWNLVDVGDGWRHFDTTPRKDHPVIFMWTEAQMMEYSDKHYRSHNYDHSLYPVVS